MTGVELAAAADRAAEADHRQSAEADPVGAEAVQLDDVVAVVTAVGPDLDPVADPGLHQRPVHGTRADVRGQADVAQRVLAGGAGAALEAGEGDQSAPALAMPRPIVPMFGTTGTLTETRTSGLTVFSSSISSARSSIE